VRAPATMLTALLLINCSPETTMLTIPEITTDPPPSLLQARLWGMILEESGACISEATVEVVSGQARGRRVGQAPCNYWGYGGGFVFDSLAPGLEMTLRATAPGYREETLTARPGGPPWSAEGSLLIWLRYK
jgi:hypothetical protein